MLQNVLQITSFPYPTSKTLIMETQNNTFFYTNHHQPPLSDINSNLNIHNDHHEQQQQYCINTDITNSQQFTKQHMFEKPLTPSDVGKLNRLVIPKQHAEKYFPLSGSASCADTVAEQQQKGLLLTFEDECGKLWRFRYSYWNSSQSYVLTKGWSRFVKDKRLDAGDVVLFERHMLDCERMFIGWTRRSTAVVSVAQPVGGGGGGAHVSEWNTRVLYDAQSSYPAHHLPISIPFPYQHDNCLHAGEVYENVDSYQRGVVATRRLRLFGVNLECPNDSEPSTSDGSSHGGQSEHQHIYGSRHGGQSEHQYTYGSNNFHHNTMRYHQHEG